MSNDYEKGYKLYKSGEYREAAKCFDKAIESNNDANFSIVSAYYYKGYCLYVLKKYKIAMDCFDKVIELNSNFKVSAYLYKGYCFEGLNEYENAEGAFQKAMQEGSNYDPENVRDIAKVSLRCILVKRGNIDKILSMFPEYKKDIDHFDSVGESLLMYATSIGKQDVVTKLLNLGANPFKGNKYGYTAFSMALGNGYEDLAKKFILNKIFEFELTKYSNFGDYIVSQISNKDLQKYLGLSSREVRTCLEQIQYYNNSMN